METQLIKLKTQLVGLKGENDILKKSLESKENANVDKPVNAHIINMISILKKSQTLTRQMEQVFEQSQNKK